MQTISQKEPNFENIQFPTSHLEAENPFGLVDTFYYISISAGNLNLCRNYLITTVPYLIPRHHPCWNQNLFCFVLNPEWVCRFLKSSKNYLFYFTNFFDLFTKFLSMRAESKFFDVSNFFPLGFQNYHARKRKCDKFPVF